MSWLTQDPNMLDAFRKGDRAALEAVYGHYAPRLANRLLQGFALQGEGGSLFFRSSRYPFDLDDLVQETFVRAFSEEARCSYDGEHPYLSYLTAVARNLIIDLSRSQARQWAWIKQACINQPGLDSLRSGTERQSPESAAMDKQLFGIYKRFLDRLEPKSRTVWRLRFEQNLPRREIQEKTGLSAMQLRTLERRLRRELYQALKLEGYSVKTLALILLVIAATAGPSEKTRAAQFFSFDDNKDTVADRT